MRRNERSDFSRANGIRSDFLHGNGDLSILATLTGNLPDNFSVDCLKQALPVLWSEQKKVLGIE